MVEKTPTPQKTPIRVVQIFCLIALIWFVTTMLTRNAPEWDNMEELVWSSSFEWGYQKHPPLPTWILYPLTLVFGKVMWLPFALGFLSVLVSQLVVYHLFKKIIQASGKAIPPYAPLVLVLASSLIIYYTTRGGDYNHNSVQLWSIGSMFYFYYSAWLLERNAALEQINEKKYYAYWTLFGIFTALAVLSKYSVLVQIIVLFAHFIATKRYKNRHAWQGAIVSIVTCALLISPHLLWLIDQTMQGLGPIFYARNSLDESTTYLGKLIQLFTGFFLTQCFRIAPILLFIYLIKKYASSADEGSKDTKPISWWKRLHKQDRVFLLFFALGPTVVAMLIGIIFGQKIEAKWAVTFYLGIGMIAAFYATELNIKKFTRTILLIHLSFAIAYGCIMGPIADSLGKQGRANFPSEKLAQAIYQKWQSHPEYTNNQPITWIAGDTWLIGNVIIHDVDHKGRNMKAWIEADDLQSPWLTSQDKKNPLLIVMDATSEPTSPAWRGAYPASQKVQELFEAAPIKGMVSIPWTNKKDAAPLRVQWAILPNVEQ